MHRNAKSYLISVTVLLVIAVVLLTVSVQVRVRVLTSLYEYCPNSLKLSLLDRLNADLPHSRRFFLKQKTTKLRSQHNDIVDWSTTEVDYTVDQRIEEIVEADSKSADFEHAAARLALIKKEIGLDELDHLNVSTSAIVTQCIDIIQSSDADARTEALAALARFNSREHDNFEVNEAIRFALRTGEKVRSNLGAHEYDALIQRCLRWQLEYDGGWRVPPSYALIIESFEPEWITLSEHSRHSVDSMLAPFYVVRDFGYLNISQYLSVKDYYALVMEQDLESATPSFCATITQFSASRLKSLKIRAKPTDVLINDFLGLLALHLLNSDSEERQHYFSDISIDPPARSDVMASICSCLDDINSGNLRKAIDKLSQLRTEVGVGHAELIFDSANATRENHVKLIKIAQLVFESPDCEHLRDETLNTLVDKFPRIGHFPHVFDQSETPEEFARDDLLLAVTDYYQSDQRDLIITSWIENTPDIEIDSVFNSLLPCSSDSRSFFRHPAVQSKLTKVHRHQLEKSINDWDELQRQRMSLWRKLGKSAKENQADLLRFFAGLKEEMSSQDVCELKLKIQSSLRESAMDQMKTDLLRLLGAHWHSAAEVLGNQEAHGLELLLPRDGVRILHERELAKQVVCNCPKTINAVKQLISLTETHPVILASLNRLDHHRSYAASLLKPKSFAPKFQSIVKRVKTELQNGRPRKILLYYDASMTPTRAELLKLDITREIYDRFGKHIDDFFADITVDELSDKLCYRQISPYCFGASAQLRDRINSLIETNQLSYSQFRDGYKFSVAQFPSLLHKEIREIGKLESEQARILRFNRLALLGNQGTPKITKITELIEQTAHSNTSLEEFAAVVYALVNIDRKGSCLPVIQSLIADKTISSSKRKVLICGLRRYYSSPRIDQILNDLKSTVTEQLRESIRLTQICIAWRLSQLNLSKNRWK